VSSCDEGEFFRWSGHIEELFVLDEDGAIVAKRNTFFGEAEVAKWANAARPDELVLEDCAEPCPPCP